MARPVGRLIPRVVDPRMTEDAGEHGRNGERRPGRLRLVVGLVVAAAATAVVVALLTGLTLPEAALASGLVAAAVGLAPAFLRLPLGADLAADRRLIAGLGAGWLAAAVAGPVVAFQFGLGLVSNATLVAAGAGAYLLGLTLAGLAAGSVPSYRRLHGAAAPEPGDAEPGVVAVGGRVEPAGDPLGATFTGADCVCLEARATERSDFERRGEDLLLERRRTAPFDLKGAVGRVRMDLREADLRLRRDLQADVAGEDVTDRAADVDPRPDRRRTLIEHRLEPGDPATVLGTARRREDLLVVDGSDLVIEDESLEYTLRAYRLALLRGGGAGLVLAVAGLAGLFLAL